MSSIANFIQFNTAVREGTISTPDAMITCARALDEEVAGQLFDFSLWWNPKTIMINSEVKSELVYESYYNVYKDYREADSSNMMRVARVILSDILTDCEELRRKACPNEKDEGTQPGLITEEMTSQICASVPQLAGYIPTLSSPTPHNLPRKLPSSNSAAALSLLWPLLVLGNSRNISAKTREWIIDQLKTIALAYDMERCWDVIRILEMSEEERAKINIWNVFESNVSNSYRSFRC
ncbi:hypothetical protein HYALB_00001004 [Hymenoscyphus albidus]|uniref:Uncharacterized protein n=1 Tax=Hymenoscyphus albidus TaxID=595503 RepID=A0A9N9Q1R9_9HELO|nr:hypothetical protein HYALB_00001004 [Hymenoscyphus albidus]